MWKSKLSGCHKMIVHNNFHIHIIISKYSHIDVKTRNMLTMSGHFYPNSDLDKQCVGRKFGTNRISSIKVMLEK